MAKILTTDTADGVTETFEIDEATQTVGVRRSQDVEPILDHVAAANQAGVHSVDGLGMPAFEVPITVAIEFCAKRGIPWEKFLYTNEYDAEWVKFGQEYSRLAYKPQRKTFSVGG
jgi:hypothetical protein